MLRSTSTVTLLSGGGARAPGTPSRRANVCRLRLTVPPESPVSEQSEKKVERKEQHPDLSNGEPTRKLPQGVVYGVVRRSDQNQQKEMVVYGWSTSQLKEEMNYIKDVRATLEKVRKRMYGDYDEMRQKIRQLTQELSVSHAQQDYLENHIQTQSSALDSFNAMNSSLATDSIGLQKTLVDVTLENSNIKDQIRNLQQTYEASMDKLREKQKQLEAAQVENQLLKMKVESSQEANAEVMREMTRKLYSQYEEKLQEEQRRHSAEKEALLEETNSFLKAIEEANKKMQAAEISLEEKDQRIGELDKLIECMEKERHQLQLQLLEHETEMSGETTDSDKERYQQLEEASASLRERIRHLDDMVHCQQKKVKQMVEEIESLKKKVQQKQLLILQLLEKISFLEGENNELQSRLDYLIETQPKTEVETREIGVGCDLLPRKFICKLPDKGKKILNSIAKLKAAIAEREEVRGKSELFHPVSLDCKLRQKAVVEVDVDTDKAKNSDQILDTSSPAPGCSSVDNITSSKTTSQKQRLVYPIHKGDEETEEAESTVKCPASSNRARTLSSPETNEHLLQHCVSSQAEDTSGNLDNLLIDKLQRIKIADQGEHHSEENTSAENSTGLCSGTQKKPHYMEVLEMRAKNPVPLPHKFKTNVLPSQQSDTSSHGQREESPVSSEERRRRDKQHLDDITAARLLPLPHLPTQLLSIEESLALQKQQKQNYEEMQAKLAAQKLAEKLNIKMQSYNPEGESSRKYREVRDEADDQSSDDEF
ncbi:myocardial zonula adherens protein isoform X2 [Tupaia chinensis]|uniref:myocardial zonula adherens protein isoform X2 n=1 Tax=Tupaia chinensis TaxID=246437 RepID=UPI0003C8DA9F|nr:myocardial zonula adherens protein isoform X2 [Tupaia chinensis]